MGELLEPAWIKQRNDEIVEKKGKDGRGKQKRRVRKTWAGSH